MPLLFFDVPKLRSPIVPPIRFKTFGFFIVRSPSPPHTSIIPFWPARTRVPGLYPAVARVGYYPGKPRRVVKPAPSISGFGTQPDDVKPLRWPNID